MLDLFSLSVGLALGGITVILIGLILINATEPYE